MINDDLFVLMNSFEKLKRFKNSVFQYYMILNKQLVQSEVKALEEARSISLKKTKEYEEYDKKRLNICEKYAQKDNENKPIVVKHQFVIAEKNKEKCQDDLEKLSKKYERAIEEYEKQKESYNELLKKKVKIKFHKIKMEDCPDDMDQEEMEPFVPEIIYEDKKSK